MIGSETVPDTRSLLSMLGVAAMIHFRNVTHVVGDVMLMTSFEKIRPR